MTGPASPRGSPIAFRTATSGDATAVAALHADSWRRHYRGSYPDEFLDGPVEDDRRRVWQARLADPDADSVTIVAAAAAAMVGFVHVVLDDDPVWGALVDNLHVRHDHQGTGTGTALLGAAAAVVVDRRPSSGLFLWVLERNIDAQAFYSARGATFEGTRTATSPGGGEALVARRCVWPDPRVLTGRAAPVVGGERVAGGATDGG